MSKANLQDFTSEKLFGVLKKTNWAIISVWSGQETTAENAVRTEKLREELTREDYVFEEIEGAYGSDNKSALSFLVFRIHHNDAAHFAGLFGLDTVVTHLGLSATDHSWCKVAKRIVQASGRLTGGWWIPSTNAHFLIEFN